MQYICFYVKDRKRRGVILLLSLDLRERRENLFLSLCHLKIEKARAGRGGSKHGSFGNFRTQSHEVLQTLPLLTYIFNN